MPVRLKLLKHALRPHINLTPGVFAKGPYCFVCEGKAEWQFVNVITDDLATTWELTPAIRKNFDARESMVCGACGCSNRLRQLAECLCLLYKAKTLRELVQNSDFRNLAIAEINSCGKLHDTLQDLPSLSYSEYGSEDQNIAAENLESLSYADASFDLVLTSDTLEHVPNIDTALGEIYRVLKPGGRHIFTIPAIWNRKTRKCATIDATGNIVNDRDPSFHGSGEPDYLVFYEYGYDIIDMLEGHGFTVKIFNINPVNLSDTSGVIIATKPGDI